MIAVNYSTARQNFKKICDKAINDFETIIITRERSDNVVLISENEYNNILENLYIRSNQNDYEELLRSIKQLKDGQSNKKELVYYE